MIKRAIKKQTKKALSFGEKAVLILALVAVTAVVSKADETKAPSADKKAEQRAKNEEAINKLLEDVPTDKELLKDVTLKNHRVVEKFTCEVALADRKMFQNQLSNSKSLSQSERNRIRKDLDTVSSMLHEHKCGGK